MAYRLSQSFPDWTTSHGSPWSLTFLSICIVATLLTLMPESSTPLLAEVVCWYLVALNRYNKWHYPTRNVALRGVVVLREDGTIPTEWHLARVIQIHPGKDNLVRLVTVKMANGIYKRPVSKIAILIHSDPTWTQFDYLYHSLVLLLSLSHYTHYCSCLFSLLVWL